MIIAIKRMVMMSLFFWSNIICNSRHAFYAPHSDCNIPLFPLIESLGTKYVIHSLVWSNLLLSFLLSSWWSVVWEKLSALYLLSCFIIVAGDIQRKSFLTKKDKEKYLYDDPWVSWSIGPNGTWSCHHNHHQYHHHVNQHNLNNNIHFRLILFGEWVTECWRHDWLLNGFCVP